VQENAARIHLREAERLLDAVAPVAAAETVSVSGEGCGCGAETESEKTSPAAEAPEPAGVTSGGTACCSNATAARFGAAGASVAIAECRQMFERWMSGVTPAETDQAPPTTVAAGSCKKEV